MRRLKSKQIITSAVLGSPPIFSRLFAEFVSRQTLEPDPADDSADLAATAEYSDNNRALSAWPIQVELYPDRLSVKLDGHIVRNLSPVEYALFTALYRKLGQPVPSSDLNDIAASRSTFRHLSNDERLETHMADLMAKVNVFGTKYIVREHDAYQLNAVV